MTIPPSSAASAYANAARAIANATRDENQKTGATGTGGDEFDSMLKQAVDGMTQNAAKADSVSLAQATGKADIVDVVTAVAETEVALRTLVSVRDRVIAAYQEVMRMPI